MKLSFLLEVKYIKANLPPHNGGRFSTRNSHDLINSVNGKREDILYTCIQPISNSIHVVYHLVALYQNKKL